MATLLHSESRRLYSWWWDSHISPKNSKWLQDNLTDMDAKVKAMIKLIEEDADSFARRAEMYYKKRPELMKLVEEFYRAYRALAEMYNHATGELRQAHRTMAQAFPDQVPFVLADDTASSSEPDTPETPHQLRSFFDHDHFKGFSASSSQGSKRHGAYSEESDSGVRRKGLKQLNDMFCTGEVVAQESRSADGKTIGGEILYEGEAKERNSEGDLSFLSKENEKLKSQILNESERTFKAENELQTLKEALARLEAEKDALLLQYHQGLDKLSSLEKGLNHALQDSTGLDELTSEANSEIHALKAALAKLEAERDASLLQYRQSSERLAAFEGLISEAEEDSKKMSDQAVKAENESQKLEQELARLKAEKEAGELLCKQCLEKIAALEKELSLVEERSKKLNEQFEKAESEVKTLKKKIHDLSEERDAAALWYEPCMETVSKLQHEISETRADNLRPNSEVLLGSAKQGAGEQCLLLGKMKESLQLEAQNLVQKITAAEQELSGKQAELEKLKVSLQDEHTRFVQVEDTLHTLQNLHSQSQMEQRALALELQNVLQTMKELELCKRDLEVEIGRLKDENQTLNDLNSSSFLSQKNLQDEILRLKEIKEKLEAEVRRQAKQSDALQLQVPNLNEEIEALYGRYQALMQQVVSAGLDPECLASSIKGLQDENSRLKDLSVKEKSDRELLLKKVQDMEELLKKSATLERSLFEVNLELQTSKEKANALQESFRDLNEEKSTLVSEKAALCSQLQIITETMQNLLEKNTSLQTSLCGANAELEGLRAKSKGLEEFCQLLGSERSNLLAEKSSLVSRLQIVEQKLEKLEARFTNLEDKFAGLVKEKQSTLSQVEELSVSLGIEKEERACLVLTSEARLSGLEGQIHDLKEENKCRKKEFEEQLEKSVNSQVEIFILQKFIQDMEDKNYSLMIECQRHLAAAKYSEKLITELEGENMIQQVEAEYLLDKFEKLRSGINQVLKALEINHESEPDQKFLPCILAHIRNIKSSLSESKDENQQLLVEKSVLSTILLQLYFEGTELSSKMTSLEQESLISTQQLVELEDEKRQLLERSKQLHVEVGEREKREEALSKQLHVEVDEREKREEALRSKIEDLHVKQAQLRGAYVALQEENLNAFEKNRFLMDELAHIKKEKHMLEDETSAIFVENLAFNYQSAILNSYRIEKTLELDIISRDMNRLGLAYMDLENETRRLEDKLLMKKMENSDLRASLEKLEEKQHELSASNEQLRDQLSDEKKLLNQKELELSEAERKLKVAQTKTTELSSTIECLEKDHEELEVTRVVLEKQIVELSEHYQCQEDDILYLQKANGNLESEVDKLHEEIEEYKIREVILTSELHERSSEFELWEAEAASFYFDLQISAIREVLFENKVHELGSLCEGLEDLSNRSSLEIKGMKGRVTFLESEAEALKSQLSACFPFIASLKDNIASLEKNPILQSKLHETTTAEEQENFHPTEQSLSSSHVISELLKLQTRIQVIEDILEKEKETVATQEYPNANIRLEAALKEIEDPKSRIKNHNQEEHRLSTRESVSETSEVRIGTEMKDIPLDQASGCSFHGISQRGSVVSDDQMLELWEAAEHDSSHDQSTSELQEQGTDPIEDEIVYAPSGIIDQISADPTRESQFEKELGVDTLKVSRKGAQSNRKGTKKNVLESLASDAQKLTSLQISIQELRRNIEPNKRRRKAEDAAYDTLRGQLQEVENSMVQLMDVNTELMKTIEESSWAESEPDDSEIIRQKRVSEQARREAERIGRLELEMQIIQQVLLRTKDEKKSKGKGGISRSNAAILLRDFFYSRERKSKKQKNPRFCGCLRPSSSKN